MLAARKWISAALMIIMTLFLLVSCTSNNSTKDTNKEKQPAKTDSGTTNKANTDKGKSGDNAQKEPQSDGFQAIPEDVQDSSDLPDWTGKQLTLNIWYAHGTGGDILDSRKSEGDVVNPEIKRVTGVTLDISKSFDNAGQTANVKMGLLAASNNWPSLVSNAELKTLVDAGKVYELTDLLPKYAPNIMKKVPLSLTTLWQEDYRISAGYKGKIYGVPTTFNTNTVPILDNSIDSTRYSFISPADDKFNYVWVRDDILKKLYPNAKTQNEIEALYMQKGSFTKEDILDVPINTKEDFFNMLYDIKKLGIKEGKQDVQPFFTASGQDNWALMTFLGGALYGYSMDNNYFDYWDKQTQKVEYMYNKPEFKEQLLQWDKLLRDGIASKEALVDPYNTFKQKLDNGLYAVSYAWHQPDESVLQKAGKTYRYRKVYLNIPVNYDKYVIYKPFPNSFENIAIFKDSVKEEDLPQVLRWLDFLLSDAGQKLRFWGPRSAGLFDETDGKRTYKDKELERHMVYKEPSPKGLYYNLIGGGPDSGLKNYFTYSAGSKYNPLYTYDRERNKNDANTFFNIALQQPFKQTVSFMPDIYNYTADVPEADKAWKARKAFEDALLKVIAASSDAQFEKLYNDFLTLAPASGYDDATLQKVEEAFRKKNASYMDNLK